MMRFLLPLCVLALLTTGCDDGTQRPLSAAPAPAAPPASTGTETADAHMRHYSVEGGFDEIMEFLQLAITGRGMVINSVARISEMLERTGKDLGAARQVFVRAEAVEFCSATLSRRMMEADPHNIVFCPYVIAVYVLPDNPGIVHIAFRTVPPVGSEESRAALRAVEELLEGLVAETLG